MLRFPAYYGLLLILVSVGNLPQARAFINVEQVRREAGTGFVGKSTLTLSGQRGNSDKFAAQLSELDIYREPGTEYLFLGDYTASQTFGKSDTNNGRIHFRYTLHPERQYSQEFFLQSEFDQFRQLKSRDLGGSNLRQRLAYTEHESFYSGYGTFYEYQVWDGNHIRQTVRANLYLSYVNVFRDGASAFATMYYQPSVNHLNDLRLQFQSGLKIELTKVISLDVQFAVTSETRGAAGVKPTDVTYQTGFSYKH